MKTVFHYFLIISFLICFISKINTQGGFGGGNNTSPNSTVSVTVLTNSSTPCVANTNSSLPSPTLISSPTLVSSPSNVTTISSNSTISSSGSTSGFLGLATWEWVLILIAIVLVCCCVCGAGVAIWVKYKAWKFNSDWRDDNY